MEILDRADIRGFVFEQGCSVILPSQVLPLHSVKFRDISVEDGETVSVSTL